MSRASEFGTKISRYISSSVDLEERGDHCAILTFDSLRLVVLRQPSGVEATLQSSDGDVLFTTVFNFENFDVREHEGSLVGFGNIINEAIE